MSDSNFRKVLLGIVPTDDDKEIKGSKLPTEHQVLLCYLAHRQCSTTISQPDASKKTVDCVIPFFQKAGVPTLPKQKMAEAVEKLLAEFENLLKIKHSARNSGKPKERIDEFKLKIKEKTMEFWQRNVLQMMDNEIDKAFLQSMMSDRKVSMSGKDNTAFSRVKRKLARENQESKRKKKWEDESESCSTAVLSDSTTTDSSTDDEMSLCPTNSSDLVSRSHKRSVKTGVGVHIPHDILKAPNVVQAIVWNKISSSAISAVMHKIVPTSEGDPSILSLSYASTERNRINAIQNITEKIAENWTPLQLQTYIGMVS